MNAHYQMDWKAARHIVRLARHPSRNGKKLEMLLSPLVEEAAKCAGNGKTVTGEMKTKACKEAIEHLCEMDKSYRGNIRKEFRNDVRKLAVISLSGAFMACLGTVGILSHDLKRFVFGILSAAISANALLLVVFMFKNIHNAHIKSFFKGVSDSLAEVLGNSFNPKAKEEREWQPAFSGKMDALKAFEILGLKADPWPNQQDIKLAWRGKMNIYYPKVNAGDKHAEEIVKQANAAYNLLKGK
jgi:hypothetical protein